MLILLQLLFQTNIVTDGDGWTNWSEWSVCSATCTGGTQTRTRDCTSGANCIGAAILRRQCNRGIDCRGMKFSSMQNILAKSKFVKEILRNKRKRNKNFLILHPMLTFYVHSMMTFLPCDTVSFVEMSIIE